MNRVFLTAIDVFIVELPFRFAFGHNLSCRSASLNLIVRARLSSGYEGWGEGIPRDYVTGETVESARNIILNEFAPGLQQLSFQEPAQLMEALANHFHDYGLEDKPLGASWCALETALLDAAARQKNQPLHELLGPMRQQNIRYGGVIPFGKKKWLLAVLWFYKLLGLKTIKLKVGYELTDDLERLALVRKILGPEIIIRTDANCAWNLEQAKRAAEAFRKYQVASIEQPLAANQPEELQQLTASIEQDVVADESLCTIKDAEELASAKIVNAFNIRISKVGGVLAAKRIAGIASSHGLRIHLGAQVGESGILTAAGRAFAVSESIFENYEGAANLFLLKNDLTYENLTMKSGGWGDFSYTKQDKGLGVTIKPFRWISHHQYSFHETNKQGKVSI